MMWLKIIKNTQTGAWEQEIQNKASETDWSLQMLGVPILISTNKKKNEKKNVPFNSRLPIRPSAGSDWVILEQNNRTTYCTASRQIWKKKKISFCNGPIVPLSKIVMKKKWTSKMIFKKDVTMNEPSFSSEISWKNAVKRMKFLDVWLAVFLLICHLYVEPWYGYIARS